MAQVKSKAELALEFAKQRQEWKKNPEQFFSTVLGIKLPPHQKKILRDCLKHNRISINTSNSVGKSFLIGAIAFFYFITNVSDEPDNSTVIIITYRTVFVN